MPCLNCKNWKFDPSKAGAKLGFAPCSLGPRWTFYPPQHQCPQHQPVKPQEVVLREQAMGPSS